MVESAPAPNFRDEDNTRDRLMEAAVRLFGQHGFDGVSTRVLTEAAGANIAAIKYHFGDKQGLYVATLERMAAEVQDIMRPIMESLKSGVIAANGDRGMLMRLSEQMIANTVRALLSDEEMKTRMALFVREYTTPSQFFPILYEALPKRMHEMLAELISKIDNIEANDPRAIIRSHILAGEILIFLFGREVILKRMNWKSFTPEGIEQIAQEMKRMFVRSLFGTDMPSQEEGSNL